MCAQHLKLAPRGRRKGRVHVLAGGEGQLLPGVRVVAAPVGVAEDGRGIVAAGEAMEQMPLEEDLRPSITVIGTAAALDLRDGTELLGRAPEPNGKRIDLFVRHRSGTGVREGGDDPGARLGATHAVLNDRLTMRA
jgi:hypothetical protein